jgi:two-component sensor histidine kinase
MVYGPDRWSNKDREAFERQFVAKAADIHGTKLYPESAVFDWYRLFLQDEKSLPAAQEAVEHLWQATSELMPASDAVTVIKYSRVVTSRMQENVTLDLATKRRQFFIIQQLLSSPPQRLSKWMSNLKQAVVDAKDYYDGMAALTMGEHPTTVFAARVALERLQNGLQGYVSSSWKSMTLYWNLPEEVLGSLLEGSPVHLVLFLENLIANAMHWSASQSQARKPEVTISAMRQGEEIAISVRDTGPGGIDLRSWSQPQLGLSGRGGSGIGLATIYYLAQALGATVEVSSPKDEGTAVTVRLPIARAA